MGSRLPPPATRRTVALDRVKPLLFQPVVDRQEKVYERLVAVTRQVMDTPPSLSTPWGYGPLYRQPVV